MNDITVTGLAIDSRQVKPGDLFIAVPGLTVDGRDYILEAIQKGAVAVLMEVDSGGQSYAPIQAERLSAHKSQIFNALLIPVPNLRQSMGYIAAQFFDNPSRRMPVIGITGTSGKTSVTHFIGQISEYCGLKCALIGTLGLGFIDNLKPAVREGTTPDAIAIQQTLNTLDLQGAKMAAMEVTSHALAQNRADGVEFHTAIFTNLTRDHLDYHQTMEQYWAEKKKLFTEFAPKFSIINIDDPHGKSLVMDERVRMRGSKVIGFTTAPGESGSFPMLTTDKLILDETGMRAWIRTPWGEGEVRSPLLGRFNVSNLLAAIAAVCVQGIPLEKVLAAVPSLHSVPGRMMRLGGEHGMPLVVVDYAHKPDALAKALSVLRTQCRGQLWCVFGCGGERDRGKRPIMSAEAEQFSDYVIMTQDNSRTEDPNAIFDDMLTGLKNPKSAEIEWDRKRAIESVITRAKKDDIVFIAGKGHETYQILGTQKIAFSDVEVVQHALSRKRCTD